MCVLQTISTNGQSTTKAGNRCPGGPSVVGVYCPHYDRVISSPVHRMLLQNIDRPG